MVAIKSAKWDQVDSLETLLGFDETEYLALFLWLAVAGAGTVSGERRVERFEQSCEKTSLLGGGGHIHGDDRRLS